MELTSKEVEVLKGLNYMEACIAKTRLDVKKRAITSDTFEMMEYIVLRGDASIPKLLTLMQTENEYQLSNSILENKPPRRGMGFRYQWTRFREKLMTFKNEDEALINSDH